MAQLVEQLTLNQWVPGSSPGGCTKQAWTPGKLLCLGICIFLADEGEPWLKALYTKNILPKQTS